MKPPLIDRAEWDFSKVPDKEVSYCWEYEYAREVPQIVERVKKFRGKRKKDFEALYFGRDLAKILVRSDSAMLIPLMCLYTYCPEWPNIPYMSILEPDRSARLRTIASLKTDNFMATDGYDSDFLSSARGKIFSPGIQYATIEINWLKSDEHLAKDFREWLKRHRKVDKKESRGKGANTAQQRKELKALSAFRLLRKYSFSEADALSAESPFYDCQASWIRGRKTAEAVIYSLNVVHKVTPEAVAQIING